jgi:hypothetical protein
MARITFSIPDELAAAAEKRAESDRRSLSAHISILVENDAKAAGMLPGNPHAELLAAAEEVGMEAALGALRRELRRKGRVAA